MFLSGVWSGLPCLLVGFVLSFLLWVWRDVLAACLLRRLRTTKDYQPQHHTHTHHSAFLPPVTVGGWFVSVFGIGPFFGCLGCSVASDQAALQRVALARSSGTPCGTARGAREQQRLRTWIVFPFCGSEAIWLAHSSGEWCSFWISSLTQWYCYAAMHCRYLLRRRRSGST